MSNVFQNAVRGLTVTRRTPNAPASLQPLNITQQPIPKPQQPVRNAIPRVIRQFEGVRFNGWIPPDTMGVVGLNHVVNVVNGTISVNNKITGAVLSSLSLNDFWRPTGVINTSTFAFDPKILYDHFSNRFFVVSLAGTSAPNSWLLVGVSLPGNPFAWTVRAIDADLFGTTQKNSWADYPSIGIDNRYFYVTANMFFNDGGFDATKIWVFEKAKLFSVLTGRLSWFEFYGPPGAGFTTQPTQVFDATLSVQYLISLASLNQLQLNRIQFVNGVPFWTSLQKITIAPLSSFFPPNAVQRNTSFRIDTGDTRLLQAIYQRGNIWTTHTVPSQDQQRAEVAWYQINPTRAVPVQQGRIRSNTRSYYYPSLAVNPSNQMVIGFSGSSANEFASAFFTGRLPSDPLGTTRPVTLLKAGQASYYLPDGSGRNRWGDFSATCLDPANNQLFWTVQEYAARKDAWGTWWGAIRFF